MPTANGASAPTTPAPGLSRTATGTIDQAIQVDPSIGLLLPCNVVVRELEPGQVAVSIMDPETIFASAPEELSEQLPDLAGEARSKLAAALEAKA